MSHDPTAGGADVGQIPDDAPSGAVADTLSAARAAIEAGQEALAGPVGGTIHAARQVIGRAGRALGTDTAARRRRIARRAREPLPMLYEIHPEARRALPHALGLRVIPVDKIAGSAVEPPQRGGDFLPLRHMRTANWRGRWQRLRQANERLAQLPPIDVLRYDDRYWATDGHNRVALALYEDQPEIDANVVDLHMPGTRPSHAGALAPLLQETREAGAAVFPRKAVSTTAPPSDETSKPRPGRRDRRDASAPDGGSDT